MKYPTEKFNREDGHSFHWRDLERSDVMYRRLFKIVKKSYLKSISLGEENALV